MMTRLYHWIAGIALLLIAAEIGYTQPSIEFDNYNCDFGRHYSHDKMGHQFIFKNIGDEDLVIHEVSTNCGCAAAVLAATSIPAGATGIVSVTMTAALTAGPMARKAIIRSNDPLKPRVTLGLKADVRKLWTLYPQQSFQFGTVIYQTELSQTLLLKNLEEEPFTILSTKVRNPEFTVETGEPTEGGVPITVTFKAGKTKKVFMDNLVIKTDSEKSPLAQFSIMATVTGQISFSQGQLYFGAVKPGETVARRVFVSYSKKLDVEELKINQITSEDKKFKDLKLVEGTVVGEDKHGNIILDFVFKAPEKTGTYTGMVHVSTNSEFEPIADLPYRAMVRQALARRTRR